MPIRTFLYLFLFLFFVPEIHAQWDTLDFQTPHTALTAAGRINDRLFAAHRFGVSYSDDFGENWLPSQGAPIYAHSIWQAQGKVYTSNVLNGYDSTWVSNNGGQTFEYWGSEGTFSANMPVSKVIHGDTMFVVLGSSVAWSLHGQASFQIIFTSPGFAYNLQIADWGNRLLLLSNDGIRWSDDAGLTWQLSPSSIPISQGGGYNQILTHGNTLFFYNREGGLLRSDDNGETWGSLPFFQNEGAFIYTIISEGDQLVANTFSSTSGGVANWRSGDNGLTWETAYPEINTDERMFKSYLTPGGKRLLTTSGCFAVSDNDTQWETRQYGLPMETLQQAVKAAPEKWVVGEYNRVYASQNNGHTFKLIASLDSPGGWKILQTNGVILINTDNRPGLLRSDDGGQSWTFDSTGQANPILKIYSFGTTSVLAQSYPNLYLYDLQTRDYHSIPGDLINYSNIAVLDGVIFTEVPVAQGGLGIQASLDSAQSFVPVSGGLPDNFQCSALFVIGEHLFAKSFENGMYVSDNLGVSWAFSPGPPTDLYFWPVLMAGAGDVAFATNGPRLLITDDGGNQWFSSSVPPLGLGYVVVSYLQDFGDTLYMAFSVNNRHYFLQRKMSAVSLSTLKGRVFADSNNNQILDSGEKGIARVLVHAGTEQYGLSNEQGFYTLLFESPGNVTPVLPWDHVSPSPPGYFVTQTQDSLDFALYSTETDVALTLESIGAARPGFNLNNLIYLQNNSLDSVDVLLSATLDPQLEFLYAEPPGMLVNDTLRWTVSGLPPLQTRLFQIGARLDDTAPIGSVIVSTATVHLTAQMDNFPENNVDTLMQTVVGSFDPNDKTALQGDSILLAEIQSEKRLDYRIRFQNTGNYPAEFVRILDTLETDFNPLTFRVEAASHPVQVRFVQPRVLEFFFDHIQLPDSISDEAGSHGFVRYSLAANTGLSAGDSLSNTAAIYFDYNTPVVTNTTVTVVTDISGTVQVNGKNLLDFTLHPNPAISLQPVSVSFDRAIFESLPGALHIFDEQGKMIRQVNIPAGASQAFINGLAAGTYMIRLKKGHFYGVRMLLVN